MNLLMSRQRLSTHGLMTRAEAQCYLSGSLLAVERCICLVRSRLMQRPGLSAGLSLAHVPAGDF